MRKAILILFVAVAASAMAPVGKAQGISPLSLELKANKKGVASGDFKLLNDGLAPLAVMLETKSFFWSDHKLSVRPLDPGISIDLSETSTLIPIKQSHIISFRATCEKLPCAFQIFSVQQTAKKAQAGHIAVAMAMGETIFICERDANHCKQQYLAQQNSQAVGN